MYSSFVLVEFGSIEKFEIYSFPQNVRAKMNNISWMIVDVFYCLTLPRNLKFGFALDIGSKVEIGLC